MKISSYMDCRKALRTANPEINGNALRPSKLAPNVQVVELLHDVHNDGLSQPCAIRVYGADLLTYYSDGCFRVTNGGWPTPTTIRILNTYAPLDWEFRHRGGKLEGRKIDNQWCELFQNAVYQ